MDDVVVEIHPAMRERAAASGLIHALDELGLGLGAHGYLEVDVCPGVWKDLVLDEEERHGKTVKVLSVGSCVIRFWSVDR